MSPGPPRGAHDGIRGERAERKPTGKMSGLWSGQPASIKLDDLDVICAVLDCQIGDVLIPEPDKVAHPGAGEAPQAAAAGTSTVIPKRRDGRSLPPA